MLTILLLNSIYSYGLNTNKLNIHDSIFQDNLNGDIYDISNRNLSSGHFSTNYGTKQLEYFDVYSPPITSRYGDVYWTMMPSISLDSKLISRFEGKVMAISGYEMDQVIVYPNGTEEPIPCTWSYNHHYVAHIQGSNSKLVEITEPTKYEMYDFSHGPQRYKFITIDNTKSPPNIPTSQSFSSGNGGESRGSFHGYPTNKSQLVFSPKSFYLLPMQIDTRSRDPRYINDKSQFHPYLLPKSSKTPQSAAYSGLAGCPCTDRLEKQIIKQYNTQISGTCNTPLLNKSICLAQIYKETGINPHLSLLNDTHQPYGCFFNINHKTNRVTGFLNKRKTSIECGSKNNGYIGSTGIDNTTFVGVKVSVYNKTTIELIGPADVWFGIAFNATAMADLPYTLIVNGTGYVSEIKLGNHLPGTPLLRTINVTENRVVNSTRYVTLTRDNIGLTADYFSFTNNQSDIPMLSARGNTKYYAIHVAKSSYVLSMRSTSGTTCICESGSIGKINGIPFNKHCLDEPYGDLIKQQNPTCFIETYIGGLSCCHHKYVLLDKDQVQPNHTMTFQIKFRFWFSEYTGQTNLVRSFGQTERDSGEYDVIKCPDGTPSKECVHIISSRFQGKDMVSPHDRKNSKGFYFIYVSGHCHYGSCLSLELSNTDTGELICHVDGQMGQNRKNVRFDEKNYVKLNPCLWGNDVGLMRPKLYSWDANFTSTKRANATDYFTGEMALWQNRVEIVY